MDLARWTTPYVDSLKAHGWIRSDAIESAFRRVPRHSLVERFYRGSIGFPEEVQLDASNPEHLRMVYSDRAFITHMPDRSVSSAPAVMALVLESLDLRPGMRVLEIGTGSGYNAAILSEIVGGAGQVTSLEITEDVAIDARRRLAAAGYASVHVEAADGFLGFAARAPYDRIVLTASCGVLSPHLVSQLAPDGMLLVPLLQGGVESSPLVAVRRAPDGAVTGRVVAYSQFMSPRGSLSLDHWDFDRNGLRIRRQLATSPPHEEVPIWEGMKSLPNPTPRPGASWCARLELLYLLALRARNTFLIPEGLGLGDANGFVLVGEESIRLYGESARVHLAALETVYREWVALGRPRMLDYESTFVETEGPRIDGPDRSTRHFEPPDGGGHPTAGRIAIGTVDRGPYLQVVGLPR